VFLESFRLPITMCPPRYDALPRGYTGHRARSPLHEAYRPTRAKANPETVMEHEHRGQGKQPDALLERQSGRIPLEFTNPTMLAHALSTSTSSSRIKLRDANRHNQRRQRAGSNSSGGHRPWAGMEENKVHDKVQECTGLGGRRVDRGAGELRNGEAKELERRKAFSRSRSWRSWGATELESRRPLSSRRLEQQVAEVEATEIEHRSSMGLRNTGLHSRSHGDSQHHTTSSYDEVLYLTCHFTNARANFTSSPA
jgi:hypothetical protein